MGGSLCTSCDIRKYALKTFAASKLILSVLQTTPVKVAREHMKVHTGSLILQVHKWFALLYAFIELCLFFFLFLVKMA